MIFMSTCHSTAYKLFLPMSGIARARRLGVNGGGGDATRVSRTHASHFGRVVQVVRGLRGRRGAASPRPEQRRVCRRPYPLHLPEN